MNDPDRAMRTAPAPVLGSFTPRFPVTQLWCDGGAAARRDRTCVGGVLYAIVRHVSSVQNALHNGW